MSRLVNYLKEGLKEARESSDPFKPIWRSICMIWSEASSSKSLTSVYYDNEVVASKFEREVYDARPDIYSILIDRIRNNTTFTRELERSDYTIILMDGLSVREHVSLRDTISETGYKIEQELFSFSSLPSTTHQFCADRFQFENPRIMSKATNLGFSFAAIEQLTELVNVRPASRMIVWPHWPGMMLEGEIPDDTRIDNAVKGAKLILRGLLSRLESRRIILSSDHGYVLSTRASDWAVAENALPPAGEGIHENSKTRRAYLLLAGRQSAMEGPTYFVLENGCVVMKGRYSVSHSNIPCVIHGGLSFMENIVPFSVLTKVDSQSRLKSIDQSHRIRRSFSRTCLNENTKYESIP